MNRRREGGKGRSCKGPLTNEEGLAAGRGAALPAMLPLGGGMRQERIGGRKRDCVQNDSEICNYRRDIDAGVEHFLTEGTIGWIVWILRRGL